MRNIDLCIQEGLSVKINSVLMKGSNDDEIISMINWSSMKGIDLRFIEFMPFDGNNWDWSKTVSEKEILDKLHEHYGIHQVIQLEPKPHSTSRNYRLSGASGSFGMISTITNPFCDTCNRIRLTADGKIKNCLFSSKETDLLSAFRSGKDIKQLIIDEISAKHPSRSGLDMSDQQSVQQHQNRAMISIGG
jgi:cyclic pyranopterin phosphate synthase